MSRDAFELMYPVEAVRCAYERGKAEVIQQLRERIEQLAVNWKSSAEQMRLGKGQRTREKAGHEVLANCAYALDDVLKAIGGK